MKTNLIQIENLDGSVSEMIEIDHENGSFTQMSKAHYDAMQAEQSTPNLP
jgi:hypothetical protein